MIKNLETLAIELESALKERGYQFEKTLENDGSFTFGTFEVEGFDYNVNIHISKAYIEVETVNHFSNRRDPYGNRKQYKSLDPVFRYLQRFISEADLIIHNETVAVTKVFEFVRIRQEIREVNDELLKPQIRSPHDLVIMCKHLIGDEDREVLLILCLSTKHFVRAVYRCHVGSISESIAHPREILKGLILSNSSTFIICHNHPSTIATPSSADLEVMQQMKAIGELMGIELMDFLIVTATDQYYSAREQGHLL